jgi:ATP-dependent RNA helicase DHX8/PRP22
MVCSELEAHLSISNRILAKFIVNLDHAFVAAALRDQGVELPNYLVRSLYAVITTISVIKGGAA